METQTVRVTPEVKQKYVLVRVVSGAEEALIVWGNPDIQWHMDIVEEIKAAGYEITEILGGGWLMPKDEAIYVWGKSDRFGDAPIALVQDVLKVRLIEKEPE